MARAPASAQLLHRSLLYPGALALAIVTVASPGATRMHAWPWSCVCAFAFLAPAIVVLGRSLPFGRQERASEGRPGSQGRRSPALPGGAWCAAALFFATAVLASALASPYRGPCLLWAAPLLAGPAAFLALFDWLHAEPDKTELRRNRLLTVAGLFFVAVELIGMALWAEGVPDLLARGMLLEARNPYPLGHSNYTAGLALLMLPCFAALAWRDRGRAHAGWLAAIGLALVSLATSASRGGFLGAAVLAAAFAPFAARTWRIPGWKIAIGGLAILGAVGIWNPRLRSALSGGPAGAAPNASTAERAAMLTAGFRMGADRPLLGWGPGATPLAYPRYRAGLEGGDEDVLELHSLPVQVWAELGAAGVAAVLAFCALGLAAARSPGRARVVVLGLSGYAAFSLTDWQLDVPVFVAALAAAAALIAPVDPSPPRLFRLLPGAAVLLALGLIGWLGRPDLAPALAVRALALGRDPAQAPAAAGLLRASLALNPDQEIAHFNLGWLLVVRDPPAAEREFVAAARLVPDKGGVYFGLGLARLNQGESDRAARAFALECLNDPLFLTSPWWKVPEFAHIRPETLARLAYLQREIIGKQPRTAWAAGEARYDRALTGWLTGSVAAADVLPEARTSARRIFFDTLPPSPAPSGAAIRTYRRERTGYPVLMRNLDLAPPLDLYDVQEDNLYAEDLGFLFPSRGWLPTPLLVALLDEDLVVRP